MKRSLTTLVLGLLTAIAIWYGLKPASNQEPIDPSIPALAIAKTQEPLAPATSVITPATPAVAPATPTLTIATRLTNPPAMENFTLQDTQSKEFNQNHFKGHWTLLFFGYAHCPDICPQSMAIANDFFKKFSQGPRLVFVTLDPKEDTSEHLKNFLGRFNKDFMGLTGEATEISKLAKYCRVYHFTEPTPNAQGKKVIDHTGAFILINPKGQLHALFSPPHNSALIAKDLEILMNSKL